MGEFSFHAMKNTVATHARRGDAGQEKKSGDRKANGPRNNAPPRHCEERSDAAIQAALQLPETLEQIESSSTPSARTLPRASGPRKDGNGVSRHTLTVNQASLKRGVVWGAFVLSPCLFPPLWLVSGTLAGVA
jgi:hypothetical protein